MTGRNLHALSAHPLWPAAPIAALVLVAGATGLVRLAEMYMPVEALGPVYALAVVPLGLVWGMRAALPAALLSVALYEWLFLPPLHNPIVLQGSSRWVWMFDVTFVLGISLLAAETRRRPAAVDQSYRPLADDQDALRNIARLVARNATPSEVFNSVAQQVGRLVGASVTHITRYESDDSVTTLAGWSSGDEPVRPVAAGVSLLLDGPSVDSLILRSGAPARVNDYNGVPGTLAAVLRESGIQSEVGWPLIVNGHIWGAMIVSAGQPWAFPRTTEQRILNFAELVATAVSHAETTADLVASRARIVSAGDAARRKLERDLHDATQQRLISIALSIRSVQTLLPTGLEPIRSRLDGLHNDLMTVIDDLRELSRGLHPALLSQSGLEAALSALARRTPAHIDLHIECEGRFPDAIETAIYSVVSESLTNAVKHASASSLTITLTRVNDRLTVSVHDDGVGGATLDGGTGLVGLTDRVEALGGVLTIESPRGRGTSITAELPITKRPTP